MRRAGVDPEQLCREAENLRNQGRHREALARQEDLLVQCPDTAIHWRNYGLDLSRAGRDADAICAYQRANELSPDDIDTCTSLAQIYQQHSLVEEAIHWHGEALAQHPDSLVLRLNHAFVWPVVAESKAQIDACRQRCREAFDRILTDPKVYLHPTHVATHHTLGLAYHGINDRAWLEAYGRLVSHHVGGLAPATPLQVLRPEPLEGRRLRLGFLSACFWNNSNSRAFEGLLRAIDRQRFTLVLIHLGNGREDPVRRRLEGLVDEVVHCPAALTEIWQRLWSLRLDLLFITDIATNAILPALLTRRCAAVQATGWGFPCTSGLSMVDYYLSGDLVEPTDGQDHYSETLIRLSGLPCRYLSENLNVDAEAAAIGRPYFFLPEQLPLVGCLQSFWKLHPDFDAVLEAIAQAEPEVLFVFVEPTPGTLAAAFRQRLQRSAPTAAERVLMLTGLQRPQYGALAGCLDLLLDTLHFGSGISFYESIASGTPIVSVEGPLLRSRYVAGGYRLMGLQGAPIAADPRQMAELSIALLRDPERRAQLRQRISEAAAAHLYDRMDLVHSFEDFALAAIARSRQGGTP